MSFVRSDGDDFYPLDLNQVVHDTLSFSRYDLTRGDTKLVEDLATPLPRVLGSGDQLEHVLLNLLTNARDAVSGRGTIRISTRAGNGKVLLEVADDGIGIGPEQLEHVFEPFYTTKPAGKGNGLGLFVAAGIARRHGAELRVSSEAGRGTRLTLALPVFSA
jgi:signal transduction histidine kinase